MTSFDFTVTTDEGYEYRPFTTGHSVGFHVTAPNGHRQVLFLNPSGASDDGVACTFLYHGDVDKDADEITDNDLVDQVESTVFYNLFDDVTTADTLARLDLEGDGVMAIGCEALPQEIELRAAEIAERTDLDRHGFKNFPFRAARFGAGDHLPPDATFVNLDRVAEWLHLYGVPAYTAQTGGGVAVLYAGARNADWDGEEDTPEYPVGLGAGWFEGPDSKPYAVTGDFTITTNEMDPDKTIQLPPHITELECAWLALHLLTDGVARWVQYGPRMHVAKAKPVGPAITA